MPEALLTTHDRKLLMETKRLMEEALETQEVLADKKLTESIRRSRRDLKAGRIVVWENLKRDLKSKGKL